MSTNRSNLHSLRGSDAPSAVASSVPGSARPIAPPRRRWLLRGVVPLLIVTIAALLLAWTLRDTLLPVIEVDLVPVIAVGERESTGSDAGGSSARNGPPAEAAPLVVAQAPGWVEPDPFAVTVQSMVAGVVEHVLVLEGQRVVKGDELIRLVRVDAELALQRALSERVALDAEVVHAEAMLRASQSRARETSEELARLRPLADAGGVPSSQITRLEARLRTQEEEVAIERAALERTIASRRIQEVVVAEAELALERMVVRAPIDGVVLARSVVPGTRIALAGDGPGEAHQPGLLSLYDPSRLQVRADVPIGDAGRIGLGTRARMTTEALPDRVFVGEVTRVLHKADLQRNTVQAKVRIDDPDPLLKPEMLVRVRFLGADSATDGRDGEDDRSSSTHASEVERPAVWIPAAAFVGDGIGPTRRLFIAVPTQRHGVRLASEREVTIIDDRPRDGLVIARGLRPGDRVIIGAEIPLFEGMKVRPRRAVEAADFDDAPAIESDLRRNGGR